MEEWKNFKKDKWNDTINVSNFIKTNYQDYKDITDEKLDIEAIYNYSQSIQNQNPHNVKARYIKGIEALNGKDYNVLFVDMAIFTTLSLVASVFLDISYQFIDPRIRMGAKR